MANLYVFGHNGTDRERDDRPGVAYRRDRGGPFDVAYKP